MKNYHKLTVIENHYVIVDKPWEFILSMLHPKMKHERVFLKKYLELSKKHSIRKEAKDLSIWWNSSDDRK